LREAAGSEGEGLNKLEKNSVTIDEPIRNGRGGTIAGNGVKGTIWVSEKGARFPSEQQDKTGGINQKKCAQVTKAISSYH